MANMSDKVAEISDPTHHTSLMTSLRNFINTESFVDVQFICQGGHKVFAHKLMLISVSRLLKKLLTESPDSNEMITVHLPDINSKLLRIVVNFLYIGYMRLNNTEMDQFKLVLGLLDIELFQKNSEQDTSSRPEVNNDPIPVQNNVYYSSNTPHVAPNVVNATPVSGVPIPNSNVVCYPQNLPTEYVPVMQGQAQHVANLPVVNRAPQYVTVNTDPLATSNGNMVYSTGIPLQTGANGMLVQNSTVQPQQLMTQQNLSYCAYPNNVPGTSGVPSTSMPQTYVVPGNMTHLTTHQMPIVSPVPNQSQAQQMVRLVTQPQVQNQPVANNAVQYSNMKVDTSQSSVMPSPPQPTSKVKRKSSQFIKHTPIISKQEIIDLSDDESTERIKSTPGPKSKTRRKSSTTVSPGSSSSHPTTSGSSTSIKRKKDSKEVIELDNEESRINNQEPRSVDKTTNASPYKT